MYACGRTDLSKSASLIILGGGGGAREGERGTSRTAAIVLQSFPPPRRRRRRRVDGAPLRSTRRLPRGSGRMASPALPQSESYPTFHVSALPLPSSNERPVLSIPDHLCHRLCHHLCLASSYGLIPAVHLSYNHPGLLMLLPERLTQRSRRSTVARRDDREATKACYICGRILDLRALLNRWMMYHLLPHRGRCGTDTRHEAQGTTVPQDICSQLLARAAAGTRLGDFVAHYTSLNPRQ